jgi:hypothetical protein
MLLRLEGLRIGCQHLSRPYRPRQIRGSAA